MIALHTITRYQSLGSRTCQIDQTLRIDREGKPKIKVVKLLSVSTGQLRRLHALHRRPINLVVYQGTSRLSSNET